MQRVYVATVWDGGVRNELRVPASRTRTRSLYPSAQTPALPHLLDLSISLEFVAGIACHFAVCGGGEGGAGAEDEAVEGEGAVVEEEVG